MVKIIKSELHTTLSFFYSSLQLICVILLSCYLFVASLGRGHHGLLCGLRKSEVIDGVRGPVAAQKVTDNIEVSTLSCVDKC